MTIATRSGGNARPCLSSFFGIVVYACVISLYKVPKSIRKVLSVETCYYITVGTSSFAICSAHVPWAELELRRTADWKSALPMERRLSARLSACIMGRGLPVRITGRRHLACFARNVENLNMKKFISVTVTVITVLFAYAARVQSKDEGVTEELIKLEREWNDAYNRHDQEAVGRVLRDDYMLVDADAYVLNKRQYLDTIPRVQVKSEDVKFPNVRVYGDAAIVNSIWSGTYSFDGKDVTETIHYTDVFIKENGKWSAVASHGTRVPKR